MVDINFSKIAARCGSQSNAFEELSSQLARRTSPANSLFERFRGAGGDGGVECIARLPDGSITGWQAKFVFDVDDLIAQTNRSLQTALSVHANLNNYVVCFPFDPTGKTARTTKKGRSAKSESDKLQTWVTAAIERAKKAGRALKIELWSASKLTALLLAHDSSGGVRQYFFSEAILSPNWFKDHLIAAAKIAGPRYTPQLNVETVLWRWFSAFGECTTWHDELDSTINKLRKATRHLENRIEATDNSGGSPQWPASEQQPGEDAIKSCDEILRLTQQLHTHPNESGLNQLSTIVAHVQSTLRHLDLTLASDLDAKHGGGSDSKRFRTYMAEYMASFPAANLDAVRDCVKELDEFAAWLRSPQGYLAFKRMFILAGAGGSGKTHGVCDMALKRLEDGRYTCVLFGHQFSGQPSEWTRLVESLGLPASLGKEGILDALNAAGEASGAPLIFCIDAVNETRPRDYWLHRLLALAHDFERRPFLKLCVSCRSSFLSVCLPPTNPYPVVEHRGFAGLERQACNTFFLHYRLDPPLVPILQPELSNPLYLKLVCETLTLQGLKRLPSGWFGLSPVIKAFLAEKEKQFAREHDGVSEGAGIVSGTLLAVAAAIAESGNAALPWSAAQRALNEKRPQAATLQVIEWLVRADLLIEDGPTGDGSLGGENVLRPAFERFGDFLIAAELLPNIAPERFVENFSSNTNLKRLLATPSSVEENAGVIQALSILLPEKVGREIPDLIKDRPVREAVLTLTIGALPWRTPDSFSPSTARLAREALAKDAWQTVDSLLAVSAYPSALDASWISDLLRSQPIAKRDSFWCAYLHQRYDESGIIKRLIEATVDVDLGKVDPDTAANWALMLLWFTAAADRRVKDYATRAAIAILRAQPKLIPPLVERLLDVDDDEVRERVLLCAYGALIVVRDKETLASIAATLLGRYRSAPNASQNAIIRDHIRCIGELARQLNCLGGSLDPLMPSKRYRSSGWALTLPSKARLAKWKRADGALRYLAHSCLNDDFNHYTIVCLGPWMHKMAKPAIGSWILKHVVEEFGFDEGRFDSYDEFIVSVGGGGRSKPVWAERIGKKYQWIGLFRLASRLHDKVPRKENSWEPKPVRTPLILMEERKLDPTLSVTIVPDRKAPEPWWLRGNVDLAATKNIDLASWVAKKDDIPSLESLLQPTEHVGQRWIILTAFPKWTEYDPDIAYGTPYRQTWMHLRAYLVPKSEFARTVKALEGRNYFGGWLPEGGKWLYAFAGEYPWATACNTEPDGYLGAVEKVRGTTLQLIHSSNEVVIEWQYDPTPPSGIYLQVPTKRLFSPGDLWWNGTDGFARSDGRTVFFDPQLTQGSPPALLGDIDDLLMRLDAIGYRLVWTMLGEKWVLGGRRNDDTPQICYSQLAWLSADGSINVGNRLFFEDYERDQGLNPPLTRVKGPHHC